MNASDGAARSGPNRILFIRHGELHETPGFNEHGIPNNQSLTVRGWQRAGALVRRVCPQGGNRDLVPDVVFASGVGQDSPSLRPQQTIAPLVEFLHRAGGVDTCFTFMKHDADTLMADVMRRSGTVLIAWEHSQIAACIAALPNPPRHPDKWPDDRYDLIWRLDRDGDSWSFSQGLQSVLSGDEQA